MMLPKPLKTSDRALTGHISSSRSVQTDLGCSGRALKLCSVQVLHMASGQVHFQGIFLGTSLVALYIPQQAWLVYLTGLAL